MNIKVGDKFIFHSSAGFDNTLLIENINEFRPPDETYAITVYDANVNPAPDFFFKGQGFFDEYSDRIEYVGNVNDMEV